MGALVPVTAQLLEGVSFEGPKKKSQQKKLATSEALATSVASFCLQLGSLHHVIWPGMLRFKLILMTATGQCTGSLAALHHII